MWPIASIKHPLTRLVRLLPTLASHLLTLLLETNIERVFAHCCRVIHTCTFVFLQTDMQVCACVCGEQLDWDKHNVLTCISFPALPPQQGCHHNAENRHCADGCYYHVVTRVRCDSWVRWILEYTFRCKQMLSESNFYGLAHLSLKHKVSNILCFPYRQQFPFKDQNQECVR